VDRTIRPDDAELGIKGPHALKCLVELAFYPVAVVGVNRGFPFLGIQGRPGFQSVQEPPLATVKRLAGYDIPIPQTNLSSFAG
jgi:hypothetical protein